MTKKIKTGWMIVNGFAIFFAILLILSFLAAFIHPGKFVWLAYFGMLFPFFLLVNIFFLIFLGINLKITALIPLFAILLNAPNIQTMAKFKSANFDTNERKLRVLSYNVNLFDHYNVQNSKEKTEQKILDFILNESPDILCFQEFYEEPKNAVPTQFLTKQAGLRYTSQSRRNKKMAFGNKIFSRFPILRDSLIRFENSKNMIVFADILAYEDTIRVFNFHLESIGFQKDDDLFYQELTVDHSTENIKKGVKGLLRKMNKAYKKRAQQAHILTQLIEQSPYSTLVCGDMNDTPASYTYRLVSKNMNDSFCKRALGLGTSYGGKYPAFRIDYIFFANKFYCENFTTIRVRYSDHFPICSDLKMKENGLK